MSHGPIGSSGILPAGRRSARELMPRCCHTASDVLYHLSNMPPIFGRRQRSTPTFRQNRCDCSRWIWRTLTPVPVTPAAFPASRGTHCPLFPTGNSAVQVSKVPSAAISHPRPQWLVESRFHQWVREPSLWAVPQDFALPLGGPHETTMMGLVDDVVRRRWTWLR
jgi:hypothetical protein